MERATAGVGGLFGHQGVDFFFGQGGEDFDVFFGVGVGDVEPELVEFVWGCVARVEPDVTAFGLAEFAAVGFGDEGACEGECFAANGAAD